jgi:type I restriction enzyme S subunit
VFNISKFTSLKKLSSKKNSILKEILPDDWIIKRGKEILKIINGISTSNLEFGGDGSLLYIKVSDMNNPINKPYILKTESTCNLINESLTSNILEKNNIVFPKRGAAIFTNKVGIIGKRGTLDPNLIAVTPKIENLDFKYLYYYLAYFRLGNICENAGLPQLNKKDLNPLKFIYPPLIQQQKIVSILENVDTLIQTTEHLIEKLQECKKGLMQLLFTEGIGHIEFKDTKLGTMPKEWQVVKIKDIAEIISGNTFKLKYQGFKDKPIPFIKVSDMNSPENKKFIKISNNYVDKKIIEEANLKFFPVGTTIFPKLGAALKTNKRRIIIKPTICDNNIMGLIPKENILSDYLYYCLVKINMIRFCNDASVPSLNNNIVNSIKIKLPPLNEQREICFILNNIDKSISTEREYNQKLSQCKKGLMQALLTGKKRVNI